MSEDFVEGLAWLRELVEVSADVTTTAVRRVSPSVTSGASQVPTERIGLALRGREDQGTPAFQVRKESLVEFFSLPLSKDEPALQG